MIQSVQICLILMAVNVKYKWGVHELGLYQLLYWGAMSQLDYLEDYNPPSPPRSKPLKLPAYQQSSPHLDANPEQAFAERNLNQLIQRECKSIQKSSILRFLDLKPKTARKVQKHADY